MLMAKNAGADGIAITHGAHDENTLLACGPLALVHDLYQVESWLNSRIAKF
jgi:phosphoglycolate phosphatase